MAKQLVRAEDPPGRRYISVDDAATYLGVGVRTVRRWIADGKLPAYRVGGYLLRVDLNELDSQFVVKQGPGQVSA